MTELQYTLRNQAMGIPIISDRSIYLRRDVVTATGRGHNHQQFYDRNSVQTFEKRKNTESNVASAAPRTNQSISNINNYTDKFANNNFSIMDYNNGSMVESLINPAQSRNSIVIPSIKPN